MWSDTCFAPKVRIDEVDNSTRRTPRTGRRIAVCQQVASDSITRFIMLMLSTSVKRKELTRRGPRSYFLVPRNCWRRNASYKAGFVFLKVYLNIYKACVTAIGSSISIALHSVAPRCHPTMDAIPENETKFLFHTPYAHANLRWNGDISTSTLFR